MCAGIASAAVRPALLSLTSAAVSNPHIYMYIPLQLPGCFSCSFYSDGAAVLAVARTAAFLRHVFPPPITGYTTCVAPLFCQLPIVSDNLPSSSSVHPRHLSIIFVKRVSKEESQRSPHHLSCSSHGTETLSAD